MGKEVDIVMKEVEYCPVCGSEKVIKVGRTKEGRQVFGCRSCMCGFIIRSIVEDFIK